MIYNHLGGDTVCRQVTINDTLASIASEAQYDPIGDPGNRATSVAGYSPGPGQWTIQFYLTATMAQVYIASIGLSETNTVGTGNLHNHLVIGYDHTSVNSDLAIDATITIVNI
ncbi:hypothetical protein KSX_26730 [Ktedonospora formicarum]|uniref:Uncharacterized protein n=1 Tax=Ktedonospora formicarum TaxID=2778364 RepID=A0A8J3MTL6_9CHLR|nr:hypothetical protein KSX_26730 [Ktedonospora formicarum]